jgi:hypothetical protein
MFGHNIEKSRNITKPTKDKNKDKEKDRVEKKDRNKTPKLEKESGTFGNKNIKYPKPKSLARRFRGKRHAKSTSYLEENEREERFQSGHDSAPEPIDKQYSFLSNPIKSENAFILFSLSHTHTHSLSHSLTLIIPLFCVCF